MAGERSQKERLRGTGGRLDQDDVKHGCNGVSNTDKTWVRGDEEMETDVWPGHLSAGPHVHRSFDILIEGDPCGRARSLVFMTTGREMIM